MFINMKNSMTLTTTILTTILFSSVASAQGVIEIRDPLRGVSYYSVEVSSDPLNELHFIDDRFPQDDSLTIGISALFFDESKTVDEYIVWFHHDGERKWFSTTHNNDLTVHVGETDKIFDYLHLTTSGTNEGVIFSEKIEFKLTAEEFLSILDADSVGFELSTALGRITKNLNQDELTALLKFDAKVRKLHSESYSIHSTSMEIEHNRFENFN